MRGVLAVVVAIVVSAGIWASAIAGVEWLLGPGLRVAHADLGQVIELEPGWNLIGLSVVPGDPDPAAVFASLIGDPPEAGPLEGVWVYEQPAGCAGSGAWRSFVPGRPAGTLAALTITQGIWVQVREAASVTVVGTAPVYPVEIPLCTGDNLIAFPAQGARPIEPIDEDGALGGIAGQWRAVFGEYAPLGGSWKSFAVGRPIHTLGELRPGVGYWLSATAQTTLEIGE
jgi:hypothetical protein